MSFPVHIGHQSCSVNIICYQKGRLTWLLMCLSGLMDVVASSSVYLCILVVLRSDTITAADNSINMAETTFEELSLYLVYASEQSDICKMISNIASSMFEQCSDAVSAEVHCRMTHVKISCMRKMVSYQDYTMPFIAKNDAGWSPATRSTR